MNLRKHSQVNNIHLEFPSGGRKFDGRGTNVNYSLYNAINHIAISANLLSDALHRREPAR